MRIKIFLFISLIFSTAALIAQDLQPIQLQGKVKGVSEGTLYLQRFDNKIFHTLDSVELQDGNFEFETAVELPELYGLTLDKDKTPFYIFLEDAPISVLLDTSANYRESLVEGSKTHARFLDYRSRQGEVQLDDFIQEDPSSIVTAFVLYRYFAYHLSPSEIRDYTKLLDSSLQNTQYVKVLQGLADTQETVLPGNKAPDFTSTGPDGTEVRFSDHLGNDYVLLDFWAAWCGPCRKENPNLVEVYKTYKDKGFSIFGVSLDKSKEAWLKAIETDGLIWTQVSDLSFWNSKAAARYGVRSIPANILIAPDGTIVARNLRGDDLKEKLAELLNTSS